MASLPFAPEIVIPATVQMHQRYGEYLYSSYGFLDSFNPSFDYDIPLKTGRVVPGEGWVASDYIGIDQGPILAMIANYRNEFVWNVMKRNPLHPRRACRRRDSPAAGSSRRPGPTVKAEPLPAENQAASAEHSAQANTRRADQHACSGRQAGPDRRRGPSR